MKEKKLNTIISTIVMIFMTSSVLQWEIIKQTEKTQEKIEQEINAEAFTKKDFSVYKSHGIDEILAFKGLDIEIQENGLMKINKDSLTSYKRDNDLEKAWRKKHERHSGSNNKHIYIDSEKNFYNEKKYDHKTEGGYYLNTFTRNGEEYLDNVSFFISEKSLKSLGIWDEMKKWKGYDSIYNAPDYRIGLNYISEKNENAGYFAYRIDDEEVRMVYQNQAVQGLYLNKFYNKDDKNEIGAMWGFTIFAIFISIFTSLETLNRKNNIYKKNYYPILRRINNKRKKELKIALSEIISNHKELKNNKNNNQKQKIIIKND